MRTGLQLLRDAERLLRTSRIDPTVSEPERDALAAEIREYVRTVDPTGALGEADR